MALFLGSKKKKFNFGRSSFDLNFFTSSSRPITNGIRLLSSDGRTLKDSKGLYLTTKKEGE